MVGDARENVGQPGLRIDIVEPGGLNQRVEEGSTFTPAIRAACINRAMRFFAMATLSAGSSASTRGAP